MIKEEDLKDLVPALDFIQGLRQEKYEFFTDNWENNPESLLGWENSIKEYQENFRQCELFFQVDPVEGTSATLVLEIPHDFGNFWAAFNAFTEEFGTGDKLEAYYPGPDYELMWFFLWYD